MMYCQDGLLWDEDRGVWLELAWKITGLLSRIYPKIGEKKLHLEFIN